jgi:ABC-2 type transport system ATP-binding protein
VDRLSLSVPPATIYGILGPNGAGKSTTLRMVMNIIARESGSISVLGKDPSADRTVLRRVGYLPEERGLYKKMTALDVIIFFGELRGMPYARARDEGVRWLEKMGLTDWQRARVDTLSKGMQQKVQFIGALLHDPDLLLLDEPFSGLDPVNSQVMKDVVVELARSGKTLLFSTHIMEQAERMCDHIVIIARGRKVVDGSLAGVKREFGGRHIALTFTRNGDRAARVLNDRSLVERVDDYGASAEVQLTGNSDPDRLLRALVENNVGLARFEVVEASLQSIFIAKVGAEAAVAPAHEVVHA